MLNQEILNVIFREANILEKHLKLKHYKNKWIGIGWITKTKEGELIFKSAF